VPGSDLRRLVAGAVALDGVGLAASLAHHALLAAVLCACGIIVSSLAAWLSRAADWRGRPPDDDAPNGEPPPSDLDCAPSIDWTKFERELENYTRRTREPLNTR
jgi:hypothetical protein